MMEPLSGVLFSLYRGTPRHGEWVVACLEGAWPRLLGEKLAQVCRPGAFHESRLTIEVLDGAWEGAIKSTEPQLLERLRTATANEVRSLRFRVTGP